MSRAERVLSMESTNIHLIQFIHDGKCEELISELKKDKTLLNAVVDWHGDRLLALACWSGRHDIVNALMELKDPSCDLDAQNESLSTALHRAAHKNDVDLVNKLIDAGADYNMKDRMGRTPFNLGNEEVKAAIQVRIDAVIAKYEAEEQQRLSILAEKRAVEDSAKKEMLLRRLDEAEDVLITGAKCLKVNGRYAPHGQEESGDWPVYQHVINQDLFLVYVYPEWLVQSNIDRFRDEESRKEIELYNAAPNDAKSTIKQKRPSFLQKLRRPSGTKTGGATVIAQGPPQRISKAYVRMITDPPSFPYHRDAGGGVAEYVDWMGGLWEKKGPHEIKAIVYDGSPPEQGGQNQNNKTKKNEEVLVGSIEVELNEER